jgi:ABC-type Fe3+-hydroxamate transport system substrate-binding protein
MRLYNIDWLAPFLCLGLVALATARPEPTSLPPKGDRVVVDVRGKAVHIAVPFIGSVLTRGTEIPEYLEATRDPDSLLAVTAQRMGERVRNHTIGRIFPQVVANPRVWETDGISNANGPKVDIERLLQFNPGVFLGWYTLAEPIERIGLPFVGFKTFPADRDELGFAIRTYARVVGKPEWGEAIIARGNQLYQDLGDDLRPTSDMVKPRYLYLLGRKDDRSVGQLGNRNHYSRFFIPPAGVENGCKCDNYYESVDAEHIIAEDPDIIVLDPHPHNELPDEFVKDPRWLALTAVLNHRVYRAPPGIDQYIASPIWSRWLAELAHPDRLQPKVRELYLGYIEWLVDYHLSDEELDTAFSVKDNHAMVDAKRFEAQRSPE